MQIVNKLTKISAKHIKTHSNHSLNIYKQNKNIYIYDSFSGRAFNLMRMHLVSCEWRANVTSNAQCNRKICIRIKRNTVWCTAIFYRIGDTREVHLFINKQTNEKKTLSIENVVIDTYINAIDDTVKKVLRTPSHCTLFFDMFLMWKSGRHDIIIVIVIA